MKNKTLFLLLMCSLFALDIYSQKETKEKLYHPEANAELQIDAAIKQAKAENKHVFLQIGGNWCGWCYRFHDFCKSDEEITSTIADNYVVVHVNYSKENMNKDIMEKYRFPNRFGFPVFVILDANGEYLHAQNSAYLEEDKGYSKKEVLSFFKSWTPAALDKNSYFQEKGN